MESLADVSESVVDGDFARSSKKTARVSDALMPIFSSRLPSVTPGACASTMNAVTRCLRHAVDVDRDFREDGEEIRVARVRDPDLGAGEEIVRAVVAQHRASSSSLARRIRAGLGQTERGDELARRASRQILLLLRLGAEEDDALAADGLVRAEVDAERGVGRADFAEDAVVDFGRRAEAAVLLGDAEAHHSELVQSLSDAVGKRAVVVELARESTFSAAQARNESRIIASDSRSSALSAGNGKTRSSRISPRKTPLVNDGLTSGAARCGCLWSLRCGHWISGRSVSAWWPVRGRPARVRSVTQCERARMRNAHPGTFRDRSPPVKLLVLDVEQIRDRRIRQGLLSEPLAVSAVPASLVQSKVRE